MKQVGVRRKIQNFLLKLNEVWGTLKDKRGSSSEKKKRAERNMMYSANTANRTWYQPSEVQKGYES